MINYRLPRYYRVINKDGICFHIYKEVLMEEYKNVYNTMMPITCETLYIDYNLSYKAQYEDLKWTEEEITEEEVFMELS